MVDLGTLGLRVILWYLIETHFRNCLKQERGLLKRIIKQRVRENESLRTCRIETRSRWAENVMHKWLQNFYIVILQTITWKNNLMLSNNFTYLLHKANILFLILATGCLNPYPYNIHINLNGNFNNIILIWSDRWVRKVNRATKFAWTNFTSSWIKKSGSALTVLDVVGRRNKTKLAYNFVILSWVVCALMNMPHGRQLPGIRNVTQVLLTKRDRELLSRCVALRLNASS
jgi:hypothetical protein